MGLIKNKLYGDLGVEHSSSAGEEDQGVAAPDKRDVQDGGKVSEVAEPTSDASEGEKTPQDDKKTKDGKKVTSPQDKETNARFAAQRRAHEKNVGDILSQEKQKREKMLASLSLKLKNGDKVKSEDDLQRYLDERENASTGDAGEGVGSPTTASGPPPSRAGDPGTSKASFGECAKGGLSEGETAGEHDPAGDADEGAGSPATVEETPHPSATQTPSPQGEGNSKGVKEGALRSESSAALRAAIEAANAAKVSFSEQAAALDARETRRAFLDDIASISHYDPSIKSPEDLDRDPKIEDVRRYMAQGNSVKDSWRLAHFDEIMERERNGERVRTQNRGTSHLSSPAAAASGDVYLSPEQAKLFRALDPKMSESDMRRALRRYKK